MINGKALAEETEDEKECIDDYCAKHPLHTAIHFGSSVVFILLACSMPLCIGSIDADLDKNLWAKDIPWDYVNISCLVGLIISFLVMILSTSDKDGIQRFGDNWGEGGFY